MNTPIHILAPVLSSVVKSEMLFNEIEDIFTQRNNATTQHERDYSDICIEWMRTLPMEAAAGALFLTPEGETTYLNSISVLLELASEFKQNKGIISRICETIDAIPLSAFPLNQPGIRIHQILEHAKHALVTVHVSHIVSIYRKIKNTILGILAVTDPVQKKMLVTLFDRYILSLAIVGQEKALSCHQQLTNLGKRNKSDTSSGYIIQSIASPDFSLRDFLLRGPISVFYGYIEPQRCEIDPLCHCLYGLMGVVSPSDQYFRNGLMYHQYTYGQDCMNAVRIIQGLKKERKSATQQFKKLYPNEHLNLVRVLTRLV